MTDDTVTPPAVRFPCAERARLTLSGPDARDLLHRISSNDVQSLAPGEGCATLLLERTGRFVDRLLVADRGEDLLIVGGADRGRAVRAHIERFIIAEDVQVEDLSGTTDLCAVAGRKAGALLGEALGLDLGGVPRFHHRSLSTGGERMDVLRAENVGGESFLVLHSRAGGAAQRLSGIPEASAEAWRALRVASGVPEFGEEFDERNVALETRMVDAISFTKGCYPGQEIVARIKTYGDVKRSLVRVRIDGDRTPERGARLFDGEESVGEIATAVRAAGAVLALAWVRGGRHRPGTALAVRDDGGSRSVEVLTLTPDGDPG